MLFGDEYCRWTYYIINDDINMIVDLCLYRKNNASVLCILYNGKKYYEYGNFKDVVEKKSHIKFKGCIISKEIIKINIEGIKINAIVSYKKIPFRSLGKIESCEVFLNGYGTILEGRVNEVSLTNSKTFYIDTRGRKTPKQYYYIAGCYKDFEGGFFLVLSNFNYNKTTCVFFNIYHGNFSKTKGTSKMKNADGNIKLKFSDYKNSIRLKFNFGKKNIIEDLGDNIDKIYKDIYCMSKSYCEIQDDYFTKVFIGNSTNTIIDKREYL